VGEERLLLGRSCPTPELRRQFLAFGLAHRTEHDVDRVHAGQRHDGRLHVPVDAVLQRASLDRDQDVHLDRAVFDHDVLQHPDVLDRPADLGIEHLSKGLSDLVLAGHGDYPDSDGDYLDNTRLARIGAGPACLTRRSSRSTRPWPTTPGIACTGTWAWPDARSPSGRCRAACPCIRTPSGPTSDGWRRPAWSPGRCARPRRWAAPRPCTRSARHNRRRAATTACWPRCSPAWSGPPASETRRRTWPGSGARTWWRKEGPSRG